MIPGRNCGFSFAPVQGAEFTPLGGWGPQGHQLWGATAGVRGKLSMKFWKRTPGSPVCWTELKCLLLYLLLLAESFGPSHGLCSQRGADAANLCPQGAAGSTAGKEHSRERHPCINRSPHPTGLLELCQV